MDATQLAVSSGTAELAAAYLQAGITAGLVVLCAFLYRRYGKPYFACWALAWLIYVARLGAIITFLVSGQRLWLYWHQVATGWTALALLWAALVFSQQVKWRWSYLAIVLFPPLWSYAAIYRLDNFLLAAGPAVLFLSGATLWTAWTFWRYSRQAGSRAARLLTAAMVLWGLHHLDYPFLRARGAWNPWGYYLDILFELAVGIGIVLLVLEDLDRGLDTLSTLSADLLAGRGEQDLLTGLLTGLLRLPAVRGSAMYDLSTPAPRFVGGVGACAGWRNRPPSAPEQLALKRIALSARPEIVRGDEPSAAGDEARGMSGSGSLRAPPSDRRGPEATFAYTAALPVLRNEELTEAIVVVGEARDPFAALDTHFLIALGRQIGAALEKADLHEHLELRTQELEWLATRMVQQHEEERRRLSRELHDETAQILTALRMRVGVMREAASEEDARALDDVLGLLDDGIHSIRSVTRDLRPSLLDDLGLVPALAALVREFEHQSGIEARIDIAQPVSALSEEAELGLFRALQEGLANVARHAGAGHVRVTLEDRDGFVSLRVIDDGRGPGPSLEAEDPGRWGGPVRRMGLVGMRERIARIGGQVVFRGAARKGVELTVTLPTSDSRVLAAHPPPPDTRRAMRHGVRATTRDASSESPTSAPSHE